MKSLQYDALTQPVSPQELEEVEKKFPLQLSRTSGKIIAGMVSTAVSVVLLTFLFRISMTAFVLGCVVAVVLIVSSIVSTDRYYDSIFKIRARYYKFATQNHMTYQTRRKPDLKGFLFGEGRYQIILDAFTYGDEKQIEFANYHYASSSRDGGKGGYTFGYIMIKLDRRLPHIFLDGTSNNTRLFGHEISHLGQVFKDAQRQQLEGDFNKHFILYVPKGYETDARYVLTPNLMQLFITETGGYDAEIVDDYLFIYTEPFFFQKAETYQRIMRLVETVGGTAQRQTDYYADSRVGDRASNVVHESGRRLRRKGLPIGTLITVVLIVVGFFLVGWLSP